MLMTNGIKRIKIQLCGGLYMMIKNILGLILFIVVFILIDFLFVKFKIFDDFSIFSSTLTGFFSYLGLIFAKKNKS